MTRVYIAIALIAVLLGAFAGTFYVGQQYGAAERDAFYQTSMNESIAAMQAAMSKQRTESREALADADAELADARSAAKQRRKKLVVKNEPLQKCLPVVVPESVINTIWLQQPTG